jgi:hypothetical protein
MPLRLSVAAFAASRSLSQTVPASIHRMPILSQPFSSGCNLILILLQSHDRRAPQPNLTARKPCSWPHVPYPWFPEGRIAKQERIISELWVRSFKIRAIDKQVARKFAPSHPIMLHRFPIEHDLPEAGPCCCGEPSGVSGQYLPVFRSFPLKLKRIQVGKRCVTSGIPDSQSSPGARLHTLPNQLCLRQ